MAVIEPGLVGGRNVTAFLDLIGFSEGTTTSPATKNDGYDVIVTGIDGHPSLFTDYSTHPFEPDKAPVVVKLDRYVDSTFKLESTASGRYQIMRKTWRDYLPILHLPDFSPRSQDLLSARLLHERGVIRHLQAGEIGAAITACANIWASFPGNRYGQGGKPMDVLLNHFSILARG